ncbi:hypothetical protein AB0H57_17530 [Micromonospora sp. NPDC050686]|uniref:hypothetical protein n=1 Tax=Micromonospora sp. NPDC050686 TaxID=3154631 RepID=UPI0033D09962
MPAASRLIWSRSAAIWASVASSTPAPEVNSGSRIIAAPTRPPTRVNVDIASAAVVIPAAEIAAV